MRVTEWGGVSLLLLGMVVAALSVTCKQQQRGREEPGPNPAPSYTNDAASGNDLSKHPIPATPVSSDPDPPTVEVLSVAIQKKQGLKQYMVTAQLMNHGPGTANISGGCDWQCPEGLILKGGAQVAKTEIADKGVISRGGRSSETKAACRASIFWRSLVRCIVRRTPSKSPRTRQVRRPVFAARPSCASLASRART
jgi:hypothetical protein